MENTSAQKENNENIVYGILTAYMLMTEKAIEKVCPEQAIKNRWSFDELLACAMSMVETIVLIDRGHFVTEAQLNEEIAAITNKNIGGIAGDVSKLQNIRNKIKSIRE
jgi:hypothetical protein